jgi:hypothetical protein
MHDAIINLFICPAEGTGTALSPIPHEKANAATPHPSAKNNSPEAPHIPCTSRSRGKATGMAHSVIRKDFSTGNQNIMQEYLIFQG